MPSQSSFFEPAVADVVAAAQSLYDDELKPFGRILLKRIRERAALPCRGRPARFADADAVPLIDPKVLRRLCERCPLFAIEPAEGREYAVTFVGRPAVFVDATSHVDAYPGRLWAEASAYFEHLGGEDGRLPCGRYACAQVLRARDLPFLRGRSLGEICHIIQLAISQKKVLGYHDGHTVPYAASEECAKQRCAVRQQPFTGEAQAQSAPAAEPYATWEDLRHGLRLILETSCNPAPGVITLSNVKRLFRSQMGLEVSETVLGHARVCELLQDPRLQDICRVEVLGCGQALVSLPQPTLAAPAACRVPLCIAPPTLATTPSAASSCASTRAVSAACSPAGAAPMVPLTIVPVSVAAWAGPMQVPLLGAKPFQPWDASTASYAESETDAGWTSGASDDLETCSSFSLLDAGDLPCSEAEAEDGEEGLPATLTHAGFVIRNTFIAEESPRAGASRRSRSVPRSSRLA